MVSMNVSHFVKNLSGINNFYTNLSVGVSLILGHDVYSASYNFMSTLVRQKALPKLSTFSAF